MKPILDPCCGGRMFYFNKDNQNVLFCDNREAKFILCDKRNFAVSPEYLADFTKLPFDDESFYHVVFDPPHLIRAGKSSFMEIKYSSLKTKQWQPILEAGFMECFRVLKRNGTLVFKWSESDIKVSEVLACTPHQPIYGQKVGKHGHWLTFFKEEG